MCDLWFGDSGKCRVSFANCFRRRRGGGNRTQSHGVTSTSVSRGFPKSERTTAAESDATSDLSRGVLSANVLIVAKIVCLSSDSLDRLPPDGSRPDVRGGRPRLLAEPQSFNPLTITPPDYQIMCGIGSSRAIRQIRQIYKDWLTFKHRLPLRTILPLGRRVAGRRMNWTGQVFARDLYSC